MESPPPPQIANTRLEETQEASIKFINQIARLISSERVDQRGFKALSKNRLEIVSAINTLRTCAFSDNEIRELLTQLKSKMNQARPVECKIYQPMSAPVTVITTLEDAMERQSEGLPHIWVAFNHVADE